MVKLLLVPKIISCSHTVKHSSFIKTYIINMSASIGYYYKTWLEMFKKFHTQTLFLIYTFDTSK